MNSGSLALELALAGLSFLRAPDAPLAGSHDTQPATYESPSGEYALTVDPIDRHALGSARYRLVRAGAEVWACEQPFTFRGASVADDGRAAGFTWRLKALGEIETWSLYLLDASGAICMHEELPRERLVSWMENPEPRLRAVLLDAPNDRLIVSVNTLRHRPEIWLIYSLSGRRLARILRPEIDSQIGGMRAVTGTPLVVVHQFVADSQRKHIGAKLQLLDEEGRSVWSLSWPDDYTHPGPDRRVRDEIGATGPLRGRSAPRRFTVRRSEIDALVTFEVAKGANGAAWEVREVASVPYESPVKVRPGADAPAVELVPLGKIELGEPAAPAPIRDVITFALDGRGWLGFVRDWGKTLAFVRVDPRGENLVEIPLPEAPGDLGWEMQLIGLSDERWLLAAEAEEAIRGFWLDPLTRQATLIEAFPPAKLLGATSDGGFVAFCKDNLLRVIDAGGHERFRRHVLSPDALAVTSEGRIALLYNGKNTLSFYTSSAVLESTFELAELLGREPRYPTGLRADVDGGLILHDFHGEPTIVRLDRDGAVRAGFHPRFEDGRRFELRGDVQFSGNGELWTSDGHALYALNQKGVVLRSLGAPPNAADLHAISALALGPGDSIHAVDRRTAAVHVFDSGGALRHVCKPDSSDFADELKNPSLSVSDAGEVLLSDDWLNRPVLHFAADGARLGKLMLQDMAVAYAQHGSSRMWVVGYKEFHLVAADGELLRTIERTPEGNWLTPIGGAAVAPDGSIAVTTRSPSTYSDRAHMYSPSGDPRRTIDLPADVPAWPAFAFDGRRLAFATYVHTQLGTVLLFDLDGGWRRFTPSAGAVEIWEPHFAVGGTELWLFDRKRTLERFSLP